MNPYRQIQSRPTIALWDLAGKGETLKAFGSIWFEDNTQNTTGIGATSIPIVPPVAGFSVSPAIGTTPGPAGLTIDKAGIYFVCFDCSFTNANAGVTFDFYILANGAEVNPGSHVRVINAADSRAVAISWILQLAAGTVLKPGVHAETGTGRALLVEDCSLTALYIGDL